MAVKFSGQRRSKLADLQVYLEWSPLGMTPSDLLIMVRRHPLASMVLLYALPAAVATADFLLKRVRADTLAHNLAVSLPHILCGAVGLMKSKLERLTGSLGVSPTAAFTLLRNIVGASINDKLELNRQ